MSLRIFVKPLAVQIDKLTRKTEWKIIKKLQIHYTFMGVWNKYTLSCVFSRCSPFSCPNICKNPNITPAEDRSSCQNTCTLTRPKPIQSNSCFSAHTHKNKTLSSNSGYSRVEFFFPHLLSVHTGFFSETSNFQC